MIYHVSEHGSDRAAGTAEAPLSHSSSISSSCVALRSS